MIKVDFATFSDLVADMNTKIARTFNIKCVKRTLKDGCNCLTCTLNYDDGSVLVVHNDLRGMFKHNLHSEMFYSVEEFERMIDDEN